MTSTLADRVVAANGELLVRGNADAAEDFFTAGYVVHMLDRDVSGLKAVKGFVAALHESFTGVEVEVEVHMEGSDRVAWQRTCTATHAAAFRGFPGTGKKLQWREMLVSRFEGDRIAEEWAVSDLAERLLMARK